MVAVNVNSNGKYPRIWVRWVTQQVAIAVLCELSATHRLNLPHLRRLPLTVDTADGDLERYLRDLIAAAASGIPADVAGRVDMVTDIVLTDAAVSIAEPDLQTMVAWWLAEHYPTRSDGDEHNGWKVDWEDHECFDPEVIAADLVGSQLIAPAWKLEELSELASRNVGNKSAIARRSRRPIVSPLQLAFTI